MIEFKQGDILHEDVEVLVNTVNCVGVMGRGIALQFKKIFPENFKFYEKACQQGQMRPGQMLVYQTGQLINPRYIVNFPTKRHWRGKSRIQDIKEGLTALAEIIEKLKITSIAVPPLGCGLGGLEWSEVRPLIVDALQSLDGVRVIIFEPSADRDIANMAHVKEIPAMTAGRAALIELMSRYLTGLLDPYVTLLEVHKLMYFMQEAGEPLQLRYAKAQYGPYAENLRHVLHKIEGHYLSGYADGGDTPDKPLSLVPGAVEDAAKFLLKHPETRSRFDKVSRLVEGFESQFGLELLSTVHWVMKKENARSFEEVADSTYAWNERKKQFTRRQLRLAMDLLTEQNWVSA
ncbi:MAG: macro domain-containing protein [bacterium]|nr:macro domain-containing protein [bacterium]